MKQIIAVLILLLSVVAPAQAGTGSQDNFFKAEVVEVLSQQQTTLADGTVVEQQNLRLLGLEGEFAGQLIDFNGIGSYDVVSKGIYRAGDKVMVVASYDHENNVQFFITDYVRQRALYWLAFVFILAIFIVGRWKGLRSLVALAATFFIIIKYILPRILAGASPLAVTLIGSLAILLLIIYLTEGFKARSHLAIISIAVSLVATTFLAQFFVALARLSGLASEEVSFLIGLGQQTINFQGLLLAGIIIGALGVLDDVVISQITTVEQISQANPQLNRTKLFFRAYQVGVSHISSMSNTLFLAYAGVSLPLLLLFVSGQSAFSGWSQIINNEAIATEIVRTMAGSIGLILSVPLATVIAVWWYRRS